MVEGEYCILDELNAATENGTIEPFSNNDWNKDGIFYFDNFDSQILFKNVNTRKLIISARIHTFKNLALLNAIRNFKKD